MHGASPLIGFSSRGVDVVLDPLHDHLQGHQILAALQDDDVRKFPAGLHVLLVHGLHCGEVLGDYGLEGAATFLHVPQGPAEDADVGVRLHEDLDVEHVPEGGVLEDQDALHDDDLGGDDLHSLVGAVMIHKGIHRALNAVASLQLLQVLNQQIGIKGIGMVIIYPCPFFIGLAYLAFIVIIVADDRDLRAEMLFQVPGQGGFAGAGAAGDADKDGTHGRAS